MSKNDLILVNRFKNNSILLDFQMSPSFRNPYFSPMNKIFFTIQFH